MTNISATIQQKWSRFRQRLANGMQVFLFMPARYWKTVLVAFATILTIILLVDGFLFWRYAYAPPHISDESLPLSHSLRQKELDAALRILRERELELLKRQDITPVREIFGLPQSAVQ
ncbi:MAG: hypothetical protein G01um101470_235 [Parcubacteria group bacterium Gr01-1014_70]|nr:MAG: hypothetical protein G01um101470_235 [Parcubacteria group bacterium Gr01-1014_70]